MWESYVYKYWKIYYFFWVYIVYDIILYRIDKIVDNIILLLGMYVKVRIEKKKNLKLIYWVIFVIIFLCYLNVIFMLFKCKNVYINIVVFCFICDIILLIKYVSNLFYLDSLI